MYELSIATLFPGRGAKTHIDPALKDSVVPQLGRLRLFFNSYCSEERRRSDCKNAQEGLVVLAHCQYGLTYLKLLVPVSGQFSQCFRVALLLACTQLTVGGSPPLS